MDGAAMSRMELPGRGWSCQDMDLPGRGGAARTWMELPGHAPNAPSASNTERRWIKPVGAGLSQRCHTACTYADLLDTRRRTVLAPAHMRNDMWIEIPCRHVWAHRHTCTNAGVHMLVYMPVHMPVPMPAHRPVHMPVHRPVHMPAHRPTHMPAHMPVHMPTHMYTYLFAGLQTIPMSILLPRHIFTSVQMSVDTPTHMLCTNMCACIHV